jgi:acyl-CoA synthetase (AMP-forming)/AMP-acid ligase II
MTTRDYASLVAMLRARVERGADTLAYTFLADGERESESFTYGELDRRARAIAVTLDDRGVGAGERALLLYPPGLDFIAAFFGCLYRGVIAVPAYPPHPAQVARTAPRLVGIATDAEISVVLATTAVASTRRVVARFAPSLDQVQWIATDALDDTVAGRWQEPRIDRDSLAFLQYTSGSTAAPRGVMISHANLLHNLGYADHVEENDATSVSVSWLPVIHDMGLIEGVLQPVYAGYPAYLMAPAAFLQRPIRWLQAITRFAATNSGGPNFAYDLCVRKITPEQRESLDLSTWRVAYNGAEPIRRDTLVSFHQTFRDVGFRWRSFYPVYGLAEATLVVSSGRRSYEPVVHHVDCDGLRRGLVRAAHDGSDAQTQLLVSSGPVSFGTSVLIVDPESHVECEPDHVGEIWVASPSVARGYWRRVGESEYTFDACLGDGRGPYLRTGDLGVLRDGEVIVTGRLKDLLIVRGFKHYPQDIELTVERSHPAVRPGSVAALSVEADGEEAIAVAAEIDPRRGNGDARVEPGDVIAAIRQRVADQHGVQVQAVALLAVGALPKTSSGKVRRQACRAAFVDGTLDEVTRWTRPAMYDHDGRGLASAVTRRAMSVHS